MDTSWFLSGGGAFGSSTCFGCLFVTILVGYTQTSIQTYVYIYIFIHTYIYILIYICVFIGIYNAFHVPRPPLMWCPHVHW